MAHQELKAPFLTSFVALIWMTCLFLLGKVRDVMDINMWFYGRKIHRKGYAPIREMTDEFYRRRMYGRIQDLWNRPICSAPGAWIKVMDRKAVVNRHHPAPGVLVPTGTSRLALNLGSYNYLGFAAADEYCTPRVLRTLQTHGVSACAPRAGAGTTDVHLAMEAQLRRFLGVDDVMTYGMGFATNSATIPVLVGRGCLILSDALNHASIVAGSKISGAKVKVFRHNDAGHLEALLRQSIAYGQPRTHRPWKKILVIIEGIYSMEGETCRCLADIVAIKKRYGAYLYLDEAHSIGAMGRSGRGVCEHYGVDPRDIDIMMGTFTKSFGSCGGYVGGSRQLVEYVRRHSPAHLHATAMAPGAVQQVLSALKLLMNEDELPGGGVGSGRGPAKVARLHDNANYFRQRLINMRLDVLGDWDSPVMPIMIYHPGKLNVFSHMLLDRHLAVVMVGFPATPVMLVRTRVCISAAHSREDLDYALEAIQQISDLIGLRYCTTSVVPPGHKQRSLSNPGNMLLPGIDGSAYLLPTQAQQQQNGKAAAANGNGNGAHANGVQQQQQDKQRQQGDGGAKGTPAGKRQQQQAASPGAAAGKGTGANGMGLHGRGKASDVVHA